MSDFCLKNKNFDVQPKSCQHLVAIRSSKHDLLADEKTAAHFEQTGNLVVYAFLPSCFYAYNSRF